MEHDNPYRPPEAVVADGGGEPPERPLAGKGRRFGTLVVDYVGYYVLGIVFGGVVGLVSGEHGLVLLQALPRYVLGLALVFAYYLFFEGLWGRTPGKFLLGTRVVDLQGGPPTVGTVAVRTLCRFIPFEAFTFFGTTGAHDSLSKTRVVTTR